MNALGPPEHIDIEDEFTTEDPLLIIRARASELPRRAPQLLGDAFDVTMLSVGMTKEEYQGRPQLRAKLRIEADDVEGIAIVDSRDDDGFFNASSHDTFIKHWMSRSDGGANWDEVGIFGALRDEDSGLVFDVNVTSFPQEPNKAILRIGDMGNMDGVTALCLRWSDLAEIDPSLQKIAPRPFNREPKNTPAKLDVPNFEALLHIMRVASRRRIVELVEGVHYLSDEIIEEEAEEEETISREVELKNNIFVGADGTVYAALAIYGARSLKYAYLQGLIRRGRLSHLKGVRGRRGKEDIVKIYPLEEMHRFATEYSERIILEDDGTKEIEGRKLIGLPTYLMRQGFSYEESMAAVERIESEGVVPFLGQKIMSGTHLQTGFWLDEAYKYLPVRLEDDGIGKMLDMVEESLIEVPITTPGILAKKHKSDPKTLKGRIKKQGIQSVDRRVLPASGGSALTAYKVSDLEWLLPQSPELDGTINLLMRDGTRQRALVPKLMFTDASDRKAIERALRAAGTEAVPQHVLGKDGKGSCNAFLVSEGLSVINGVLEKRGKPPLQI